MVRAAPSVIAKLSRSAWTAAGARSAGSPKPPPPHPADRVDVGRPLHEVLLSELEVHWRPLDLVDVLGHLALRETIGDVALRHVGVAVGGRRIAAHEAGRGRRRVPGRQGVLHDLPGVVGDEAALRGHSAPKTAGPARVGELLAVEEQHREALLGVLDVRELADGGADLPAGVDAVRVREGPDGAPDGVDQNVAVALAPLVDAPEDGARPLARPPDAQDVAGASRGPRGSSSTARCRRGRGRSPSPGSGPSRPTPGSSRS